MVLTETLFIRNLASVAGQVGEHRHERMRPEPDDQAPDVVQAVPVEGGPGGGAEETSQAPPSERETIAEPAKLLRIASMVRELLDETRQASLDESGRGRLADVYQRTVGEPPRCLAGPEGGARRAGPSCKGCRANRRSGSRRLSS